MYMTYFMVRWQEVEEHDSEQKCQICGGPLKRTEEVIGPKGLAYEGYVCHRDKRVAWVRKPRSA